MRRVAQIPARYGNGGNIIEDNLNEFLKTLPRKGDEVVDIKYLTADNGNVYYAMVLYELDEVSER
jgi:hypothetical protein